MIKLSAALAIKEPALTTRWFIMIYDPTSPENSRGGYEAIAEAVELPFPKNGAKPRFAQATNYNYPEMHTIDAVSITFYENHTYDTTNYLKRWRDQVFDISDGSFGMPSVYQRTIECHLYKQSGELKPQMILKYLNAWPTDQNSFALQYEDVTGRLQVVANFSVNEVLIQAQE